MNDSSLYLAVVRGYDASTGIARVTVPALTGKDMVPAWASHGIPLGEGPVPGQTVWVSFWNPEQPVWNSESAVLEGWVRIELDNHEARLGVLEAADPPWEPMALIGGWRNYGGGYAGAEMRSLSSGMVELRGLISGGSGPCCRIPWEEKWMPTAMSYHATDMAANAHAYVMIDHDDNEIQPSGSAGYFSLSGVRYGNALATGWIPVTFQNGWHNYNDADTGKLEQDVQYRKLPNGDVEVRGTMLTGTPNTTAFTLPVECRPPESLIFAGNQNGAHGRIDVQWDGPVVLRGGAALDAGYYSINFVFTTLDAQLDGSDHPGFTYATSDFQNSWVNYGLPWQEARFMRRNDKSVMLDGLIKSGTPFAAAAWALPRNNAPGGGHEIFAVDTNSGAHGRLDIQCIGNGPLATAMPMAGSSVYFSLSGARWATY